MASLDPIQTTAGLEPAFDLATYFPVFLYLGAVAGFAAFSLAFHPPPVPEAEEAHRRQADALRVGHGPDRRRPPAVRRQVLPDRHPVPRLRRRAAVPLSVGGRRLPRGGRRCLAAAFGPVVFWEIAGLPRHRWSSPTSTPGGRGCSNGGERPERRLPASPSSTTSPTGSRKQQPLADAVRHRLLRHRADGDRRVALRHRPLRRRGDALQPAAVRPDDRRRPRRHEDGAGAAAHLAADARAEVVHLDGGVRVSRAASSTPTPSCRAIDRFMPGGRLRARLPAAAGAADPVGHRPAGQDPADRARIDGTRVRASGRGTRGRAPLADELPPEPRRSSRRATTRTATRLQDDAED